MMMMMMMMMSETVRMPNEVGYFQDEISNGKRKHKEEL